MLATYYLLYTLNYTYYIEMLPSFSKVRVNSVRFRCGADRIYEQSQSQHVLNSDTYSQSILYRIYGFLYAIRWTRARDHAVLH